ncbi:hypothetical protein [Paracidovorax valerianellae]|uniref:Uncharacterized protein n=1 Tax=Paracidovorax valerianellae TaxID=187868 RepID=A0A1G7A5J6_9BURK|nr:hypothetical protein [Paracidovorax valerianellae]MDA8443739.1 hypothetical protein [Paracidovorax valerianellae]SDE10072.1 hypothetical protein SAMN05192589_11271 [Paracidovorax valerianellae]
MPAIRYAAAALLAGFFSQGASAACYLVYSADQQIIYRSQRPPVDLARQVHETLPRTVPGGTLVFSLDNYGCELEINRLPASASLGGMSRQPATMTPRRARADRS